MECFHMTSRQPYWCPKTMKWWPCGCPKPILWGLNSFLMQTLFFVPINLHRCWSREWKRCIGFNLNWIETVKTRDVRNFSRLCWQYVLTIDWTHSNKFAMSAEETVHVWFNGRFVEYRWVPLLCFLCSYNL